MRCHSCICAFLQKVLDGSTAESDMPKLAMEAARGNLPLGAERKGNKTKVACEPRFVLFEWATQVQ